MLFCEVVIKASSIFATKFVEEGEEAKSQSGSPGLATPDFGCICV